VSDLKAVFSLRVILSFGITFVIKRLPGTCSLKFYFLSVAMVSDHVLMDLSCFSKQSTIPSRAHIRVSAPYWRIISRPMVCKATGTNDSRYHRDLFLDVAFGYEQSALIHGS
jgi:hypothetical protein